MRKPLNRERVEGRIYSHKLALKTVTNEQSANFGKPYIGGSIDVATDNECLNIITVNFTYVTEFTKSGTRNATYTALMNIINGGKTVATDGKENATKVAISTAFACNDFISARGEEVAAKRNEGGFVSIVDQLNADENLRNTFDFDVLANEAKIIEADEERNIPADYLELNGFVFNFRNEMQPVTLVCKTPEGMAFLESFEISHNNPIFLRLTGNIVSTTINVVSTTEAAFGVSTVSRPRSVKEWVVTSGYNPYEIGDEVNGITADYDVLADKADKLVADIDKAESTEDSIDLAKFYHDVILCDMEEIRAVADGIEEYLPDEYLPYPTYSKMLFYV